MGVTSVFTVNSTNMLGGLLKDINGLSSNLEVDYMRFYYST